MMAVNRNKPDRWKRNISLSIDMYNNWFDLSPKFAPSELAVVGERKLADEKERTKTASMMPAIYSISPIDCKRIL